MDARTQAATWLLTHCPECVKIRKPEEKENENEQKV